MSRITFYFVRHGESEGNRDGLFRGRHDFPLTQLGIKQAESVRDALRGVDFSLIAASPLKRAYDTAKIIAGKRPVRVMEAFNSINLSVWEGKSKDYIKEHYPEEWNTWLSEPENLKLPGGETIDEVRERAVQGVLELVNEFKSGGLICVVTHTAVLKALLAGLLNINRPYFWKLYADTASYSIVEYNDKVGFTLIKLNVTYHLPDFKMGRFDA